MAFFDFGASARTLPNGRVATSSEQRMRFMEPLSFGWRMRDQAPACERRSHSSKPMRPRRASLNGTSERSSTRPPKYRASGSLTTLPRSRLIELDEPVPHVPLDVAFLAAGLQVLGDGHARPVQREARMALA